MAKQLNWDFRTPEEKAKWAYVAGLIDGEGYISLRERKDKKDTYTELMLRVTSVHKPTLDKMREVTKVGTVHLIRPPQPPRRALYRWHCGGKEAAAVLRSCQEWLVTKAERAKIAMEFYQLQELGQGTCPIPAGLKARREELTRKCRELNQRGEWEAAGKECWRN